MHHAIAYKRVFIVPEIWKIRNYLKITLHFSVAKYLNYYIVLLYLFNIIMRVHFGFSLVENCAMMSSDDVIYLSEMFSRVVA